MKKLFLSAIALLPLCGNAQTVSHLTPGNNNEGVSYYLPQTTIRITVEARRVVYTPGEFARYADRFLRLNDVKMQAETTWEIETIEAESLGRPDPAKGYTVELVNGLPQSNIQLTPDGIIAAINTTVQSRRAKEPSRFSPAPRLNSKEFLTEEILLANSTAKMAELTAKEIYAIRDSKSSIARGQAEYMPQDGAAISLMMQRLDQSERALVQLFTGVSDTTLHSFQIDLTPAAGGEIEKEVLFRFSKKLGVLGANNMAGAPIYYSVKNLRTIVQPQDDEKGKKKKESAPKGIVYNLPEKALLVVCDAGENYIEENIEIAQWGCVETLSSRLFSKKSDKKVIFNTATGAVESISE